MPFLLIVFLFIGIPIVEISVLIRVTSIIGGFNTIAFVIFTAVLGAYLVKQQGLAILSKLQEEASAGRVPAQQIMEGVALLIAGAVLLTPGFVTDAFGFALLVPPIRVALINWAAQKSMPGSVHFTTASSASPNPHSRDGSVIEGEFTTPPDDHKKIP